MNAIEIMMNEHRHIEEMLNIMRAACLKILTHEDIDYNDFDLMIKFVRNYADGHHHNKEEVILFNIMTDNLGVLAEKLIKYGMLVEHDLGRLYISNLEEALGKVKNGNEESKLDLIGNAIAYCDLLKRHIDKEDRVVYTFAERELSEELLSEISNKCMSYEEKHDMIKEEYIFILNELKNKYLK